MSTWQIVNNELRKNNVHPFSHTSLMVNGRKVLHPKQLDDTFNNFFSAAVEKSVFPNCPIIPKMINRALVSLKIS